MHKSSRHLAYALLMLGLAHPVLGQLAFPTGTASRPMATLSRLSRKALRTDLIGCYALYFERGRVDASLYNAAPSVRLDSIPWGKTKHESHNAWFGSSSTVESIRSMTGLSLAGHPTAPRGRYPPRWTADSLTDSVSLSFIDGYSGAVFVLNAPPGRTAMLRGRVFEFWDGPAHLTARGPAGAVRESCPP
jgi:hypothetical protein